MVMIAILLAVLLMVPLITRATRPRGRSQGVRWQGIDWERVMHDDPSAEASGASDEANEPSDDEPAT